MPPASHLIFDADDTLWETNRRYELVLQDYIEWLQKEGFSESIVRAEKSRVEEVNSATYGVGAAVYLRTLTDTFESLTGRRCTGAETRRIAAYLRDLENDTVDLIPHVAETLSYLGERYELSLL